MATGGSDDSSFELYECQVCMTHMVERNPRMLACHHYFCQRCLAQLLTEGEISCPTCRKFTRPKDGKVANLPMNLYLLKIWERDSKPIATSDTSVNTIKEKLATMVKAAELSTEKLMKTSGKVQSRINETDRNRQELESKREYHLQELAKLDNMEEDLNVKRVQDQQILNTLADVMLTWKNYHPLLKALEKQKDPDSLLKDFEAFEKAIQSTLEKTNHALSLEGDQALCQEIVVLSLGSNRDGSHLDLPWQPLCKFEKLTNISCILLESRKLRSDITVMSSGNLCVADRNLPIVLELDQTGRIVQSFKPESTKRSVRGLSVYNDSLYILQHSRITKLAIGRQPTGNVQTFRPGLDNMCKILVVDTATIIISDWNAGEVYQYNPETDTPSLLLQGLGGPTYISMATTERGVRYAVTEEGKNRVNVYDDGWTLVTSAGGHGSSGGAMISPRSALITPAGELLVADCNNHRISMFTCDGNFQKQLLTKEEGIQYPVGLAYKHPHLRILESIYYHKAIKCYFIE